MIEKKINPSDVPVCDLLTATLQSTDRHKRSISQLKIGIKFHSTVLHAPFSLSLLVLLVLSHNIFFFFEKVEKKNPTDNKLQTRLIDEVARFHSNAGDE